MKSKSDNRNVMFIKGAPDYLIERANKIMNSNGEVITLDHANKNKLLANIV
jgi:Ca2+-transporting ATPase